MPLQKQFTYKHFRQKITTALDIAFNSIILQLSHALLNNITFLNLYIIQLRSCGASTIQVPAKIASLETIILVY